MLEKIKALFGRPPEELSVEQRVLVWRLRGCPAASRPPEIDDPFVELRSDHWLTVSDTQRSSALARTRGLR